MLMYSKVRVVHDVLVKCLAMACIVQLLLKKYVEIPEIHFAYIFFAK